jgi:hypothetical protein
MRPNSSPRNGNKAATILAAAGLAVASSSAFAQIHWNNTGGGVWSDPLNWTPNNVPDNTGEAAVLDAAGSYLVQLNNTYQVGSVSIPVSTVQLGIADARELQVATAIDNNGVIRINQTAGGNGTGIRLIGGNLSLTGTGALELNASGNLETAYLTYNNGGWAITNAATHTIRGTGRVHPTIINDGVVSANRSGAVLNLATQPKTNNNLFTATGGGILDVNCGLGQGASGKIDANGGIVQFTSASVTGGQVNTLAGGTTRINATSTFADVTTSGAIDVLDSRELNVSGVAITNNGTINVNSGGGNGTGIRLAGGNIAFNGTGAVVLQASSNLDTAYFTYNNGGWVLTQAATHTIRGTGKVHPNTINNGTINADQNGKVLMLVTQPKTNNNLMTATAGGILDVTCAVTQPPAGRIRANNGIVRMYSASVTGGQIGTQSGGLVQIHGTTTLDGVTNTGIVQQLDSTTAFIGASGVVNNGTWTVNQTAGGNGTPVNLSGGNATLSGTGSVVLNASGNRDTATMYANNGGWVLTQGAGHTIRGTGKVHVNLTNNGVVQGDVAGAILEVTTQPKLNNNIFRATNTGILSISTTVTQGAGGRIICDNGETQLGSATIIGGTMESANAGRFEVWGTTTLNSVTNSAPIDVHDARTLFMSTEGMTNNGTITVNEEAGGNGTSFYLSSGNGTLSGSGALVLNASANRDTATIYANNGGWVMTQGAGHTIRGTGRVHVNMTNNGTVSANLAGKYLELVTQPKTNNSIFRATGGGLLGIGTAVTQGANGRIIADNSVVQTYGATINAGTMEAINGGRFDVSSVTTLNGAVVSGPMNVFDNQTLQTVSGFTNNGTITVNSQQGGNGTRLLIASGPATIGGTGTIVLNASANLDTAQLSTNNGGWTMTLGPGQTLKGNGRTYTPVELQGTIAPGLSAGRIEPRHALVMTPSATADIEIGGTAAGTYDVVASNNPVTVDGTLRVNLINGFNGGIGQEWTVISGSSLAGRFDTVVLPPPPVQGIRFAVQYTPSAVVVRVTCNADYNADGQVDFFDYLDFVAAFNEEAPEADFNGDNQVDFFDYLDFVAEVESGCS